MANVRGGTPVIRWGVGFGQALVLPGPLDECVSYSEPREGSLFSRTVAGVEDSWVWGTDHILDGVVRHVPGEAIAGDSATAWDAANGWREFLAWARAKNPVRFYPGRNLIANPAVHNGSALTVNEAPAEWTPVTGLGALITQMPGPKATRIAIPAGGNTSGVLAQHGVKQDVYGWRVGDPLVFSVEWHVIGLSNGARGRITLKFADLAGATIGAAETFCAGAPASYARSGVTATVPAGTATVTISCFIDNPANTGSQSSGEFYVRHAVLEKGIALPVLPLNSGVPNGAVECVLAEPMQGGVTLETNGTRKVALKLRSVTTPFDGY